MDKEKLYNSIENLLTLLFGHPVTALLSLVTVSSTVSLVYYARFYSAAPECVGPPYLYATTHHEVPNILKYSRNGCLLSSDVLQGMPGGRHHVTEFRSLAIGQYLGEEALYIADADSGDSYIFIYGTCDAEGHRNFTTTLVSSFQNRGLNHVYGLTFDHELNIYASSQHTDNVLRFKKDTFEPMDVPPALSLRAKEIKYYPGTFYQFGRVGLHPVREQGIRSIKVVEDTLWIANEDISGVVIVDLYTGIAMNIVLINKPIGLHYDKKKQLVFVGSKEKHWGGAVYAVDPVTLRVVRTYTSYRMNHPSGIISHDNTLFVAEQVLGEIVTFDIDSGKFLQKIVKHTPGEIEQLELSMC